MNEHQGRHIIPLMIATLFGIGRLRPAPGTWGSLAALPFAIVVQNFGGFWVFAAVTCAIAVLSWWAVGQTAMIFAQPDPPEIVIDEVVGQWIALWPVAFGAQWVDTSMQSLWPGILTAFVAFRILDIWKPGPIGWADARPGAFGIMADDMIAGGVAALIVVVFGAIAHGVLV